MLRRSHSLIAVLTGRGVGRGTLMLKRGRPWESMVGSGQFGTPWERMHRANFSPALTACCTKDWGQTSAR